jgi:hypothetical protein
MKRCSESPTHYEEVKTRPVSATRLIVGCKGTNVDCARIEPASLKVALTHGWVRGLEVAGGAKHAR